MSAKSTTSVMSQRSLRSSKSLYKQQPSIIKALAYKNGSRTEVVTVTAPNLKLFLEECTLKLGLLTAARKVYLTDGTEAKDAKMIPRDAEVYISCGEQFKDPYASVTGDVHRKIHTAWTVNGVVIPAEDRKKKTKATLSKRMRKMLASNTRRIIVFRNGDGVEPFEALATPDKFEKFLDVCTMRLGMSSPAKVVFSWEGKVIEDINEITKLDKCLQTSSTPAYGPVWISRGEGFSPKGSRVFLRNTLQYCEQKIGIAKEYKEQLQLAIDGENEKVSIARVLSLSEEELQDHMNGTNQGIEEFTKARDSLKRILRKISDLVQEEEIEGHSYTMKHIKAMDASHRLVGMHGIRLKVYENGFNDKEDTIFFNIKEAYKGCHGNSQMVVQRLLDHITHCVHPEQNVSALSSIVTKLFDKNGQEITDVSTLENDQEVWISYGENFRDPNVYCLQLTLDKACGFCLYGDRNVALREAILADDLPPGKEKSSNWDATIGFPVLYDIEQIDENSDPMKRDQVLASLKTQEIDTRHHFLQDKDSLQMVLYPDLDITLKRKLGDKEVWPLKSQTWVINKKGVIYCRAMTSVALTLGERCRIDKKFPDDETPAQGYAITLDKKSSENPAQQWGFSPEGFIYSLAEPDLVLTYIPKPANGGAFQDTADTINFQDLDTDPEQQSSAEDTGEDPADVKDFPGHDFIVAAIGKLPARHPWAKSQRWALKQERIDNLGQWKHSTVQNPLWNKLAYSWPVTEEGTWNEEFDWPMEAFIIPYAPPMKVRKNERGDMKGSHGGVALRLRVLKNGEKDENKASYVVGPDLSNMMRDLNRSGTLGRRAHRRSKSHDKRRPSQDGDTEDGHFVEDDKMMQMEFQLFLDRSTSLLNLPFAARRLFDSSGKEFKTLFGLQRDQLVHVSCGEAWNDPNNTAQDQQRRMLLATLSADIEQMQEFLSLRDTLDYVLEKDRDSQRLIVNKCCVTEEEKERIVRGPTPEPSEESEEEEDEDDSTAKMSFHQRSHANSEQRLEGLKWPWERVLNASLDEVTEANQDESQETDLFPKSRSKKRSSSPHYKKRGPSGAYSQRFSFIDGFIILKSSPYLVVGITQPELEEKSAVTLCKKTDDDPSMRWEITEDGYIQSKINADLVLAVSMPSFTGSALEGAYCGQSVVIQRKQNIENGGANQRWMFEKESGFMYAFYAETQDREILAANKAGVCTYAVVGESPIQQNGYDVVQTKVDGDMKVCVACARAMRGNYKLKKQEHSTPFICCVGLAPKMGLKLIGSFQCLSGKVDLSSFEAENTVMQYEKELRRLKQMTSARLIAREISAYQPIQSVRVLAYKNGDGRSTEPVTVIGSTIRGVLDQCTYQLQLNIAARRLYSQDGTLLLSIPDMIKCNLIQQGLENLDISVSQDRNRRHSRTSSVDSKVAMAMRKPIEVWVSCGEPFVSPGCFDHRRNLHAQQREERAEISLELDKEKHILRQMQGRRTAHYDGPDFKSTMSPEQPVVLEGGWTQPSNSEIKKSVQVHQLRNHLTEVKAQQRIKQTTKSIVNPSKMLYKQPVVKRLSVYRNGDNPERATFVWANSMDNLLTESTSRLSLHMPAKRVFSVTGELIEQFDDIDRDQVVCVSSGESFKNNKAGSRQQVEMRATWSRTRKREGPQATQITVTSTTHPAVQVDPFGPPSLALPVKSAISDQPYSQ